MLFASMGHPQRDVHESDFVTVSSIRMLLQVRGSRMLLYEHIAAIGQGNAQMFLAAPAANYYSKGSAQRVGLDR